MRIQIRYLALLFIFGISSFRASAQTTEQKNKSEFMVEIDPLPYIMGGAGGHFGWSPKKSKHFTFGLSFIAQTNYPKTFVELDSKNKEMGWSVKINQGMGLWTHYYFDIKNKAWFVGMQFFTQEMELTNDNFPRETDRTNTILIAAQAGYLWYPFKKERFYLRPWAGFGYQSVISGTIEPDKVDPDLRIGDKEYHLATLMPFASIHFGFRF
jgi:hypothetical protein